MSYGRPVPTQACQQADSSEGGFAKIAPLPFCHFFFIFFIFFFIFFFFIFIFLFPFGVSGLGLDMRWEFDGGHLVESCPASILKSGEIRLLILILFFLSV